MYVYVVGWHPSVGSTANGGFEWRYSKTGALNELLMRSAHEFEANARNEPEHNLVFAKIHVPFEFDDPFNPKQYDSLEHKITSWLDENLNLIELPLQEVSHADV